MDNVERNVSLFGVGIAMIVAVIYGIAWSRDASVTNTLKYAQGKKCPTAYPTRNGEFCERIIPHDGSYWAIRFLFIFVVALIILFFTLRRKRAGVVCFAIFMGFPLGLSGAVFIFLGAWLIVRAFRLQRYGEASWSKSNKAAREMAQARKEGRDPTPKSASKSDPAIAPGPAAPPTASKRYTPKQKPRKR